MSSSLILIIALSVLHVTVFSLMLWIRFRRDEANGAGRETAKIRLCAVCSEPATYLGYDGLDPHEQRHPDTGRPYSINAAHYQPLCAVHC